MTLEHVMDHLWQSTLVVGAIALLTLGLRRTLAQTRYWIWFAASVKFLVPFAALTSIGAQFQWRAALPATPAEWTVFIASASQPFSAPLANMALPRAMRPDAGLPIGMIVAAIWALGCVAILSVWLLRWRRVSAAVRAGAPITSGRVHDTFTRLAESSTLPLVASDTSLEPGVFGIVRPVLLWPRDIDDRLDDAQVHAILAHELAHVRRRDNLTATAHMLVEAVFWFHPLVWWIGSRLVDERERACDEEVLRLGNEPHVYAESILKTCQFYVESPLSCVPGVTGSDLKKRIERIMAHREGASLGAWGKSLLVSTAVMTLAAPVAIGALTIVPRPALELASTSGTPSFTNATVKANTSGAPRVMMRITPGGIWDASNVTLESMVRLAYRLQESQLAAGPAWIYTDRFDIQTQSEQSAPPGEFGRRMQSLLQERFNLKVHTERRELPIYALVFAASDGRRGPSLMSAAVDCVAFARDRAAAAARGTPLTPVQQPGERPTCGTMTGRGRLSGGGVTMEQMALTLSQYTGRMVVDRTGVNGSFDYELRFAHNPSLRGRGPGGGLPVPPEPEDSSAGGVSIFAAVQDQLGLKLNALRAPVDVLVIDSVQHPTDN